MAGADGKGPVGRLFQTWKEQRIETKLATKYKIVLGAQGSGSSRQLYMNIDGHAYDNPENMNKDLKALLSDPAHHSIFDIGNSTGSGRATKQEVREAIKSALKDATLWDRTYFRFKLGKFIETKYGVKRCIIACDIRDTFSNSLSDKKNSAKAYIIRRVIGPASESYSLMMQCVLASSADFCKDALDPAKAGEDDKLSPVQKKVKEQLAAYSAKLGEDSLKALTKAAEDISKDGIKKVVARAAATKLATLIAGDAAGQAAGQTAEDAVPIIGWVMLFGQIGTLASDIGPLVQHLGYAASAASAVALFSSYQTVASEAKSGHMDATELGSFTDALSTNLTGAKADQVDATQTPLYANLFGGNSSSGAASIFGSLFGLSASADPTSQLSKYTCNDGNPVPKGKIVCPEEQISRGNSVANDISKFANAIPGSSVLFPIVKLVNAAVGAVIQPIFQGLCDTADLAFNACSNALDGLKGLTGGFFTWLENELIDTPFSDNMSGGRSFDLMAAGADVSNNASCKVQLGCGKLDSVAVMNIQNQQIAEQKAEFDKQPLFARMFSTDSSYSLVSQLAMGMPTTMLTATNAGFASMLSDPLGKLGGMFSSMFSSNHAFAATTAQDDPFGVIQYGYQAKDIPAEPEAYWNANCADPSDPTGNTLDQTKYLAWLNGQPKDDNTGEAVATTPFPCLLIQSAVQSVGGISDPSLLPDGSTNGGDSSTAAAPTTSTSNPTIVLDPGHSPATNGQDGETGHTDAASGLNDADYENDPEMQDVWDVSQLVKQKLTTDGYNVVVTKLSENEKIYQAQRSAVANNANAALALSIHDNAGAGGCSFSSSSQAIVYDQSVGTYRTNPGGGNKVTFTDQGVASTSQQYGAIFQKDRSSVEGKTFTLQNNVGYDLGNRGKGFDPGNIWLVQLLSKVPWIYNESCGNSAGQTGLNQADKQKYADGLIKSVEDSVPITAQTNGAGN